MRFNERVANAQTNSDPGKRTNPHLAEICLGFSYLSVLNVLESAQTQTQTQFKKENLKKKGYFCGHKKGLKSNKLPYVVFLQFLPLNLVDCWIFLEKLLLLIKLLLVSFGDAAELTSCLFFISVFYLKFFLLVLW